MYKILPIRSISALSQRPFVQKLHLRPRLVRHHYSQCRYIADTALSSNVPSVQPSLLPDAPPSLSGHITTIPIASSSSKKETENCEPPREPQLESSLNESNTEEKDENRWQKTSEWAKTMFSSWQKGIVTAMGACTGIVGIIYIMWAPVRADTVNQTAQIASKALEDGEFKQRVVKLTREVVEVILTDKNSVTLLAEVIAKLLQEEQSRKVVTSFIKDIFEDHYTQEITKKFVLKIVSDSWVLDQLHHIFYELTVGLLKDKNTEKALKECLVSSAVDALQEKELRAQTGKAIRSIMWQTLWNSSSPTSSSE